LPSAAIVVRYEAEEFLQEASMLWLVSVGQKVAEALGV
jgi:hypothetical protein